MKCSINVKSSWLIMLFKSSISLFIFCLRVPSIIERVMLKSLTIIGNCLFLLAFLSLFALCILKFCY